MDYSHFEEMRVIGGLTADCLKELKPLIKPGITTALINDFVFEFQKTHGIKNSQKNYMGFPAWCCVSVNETVCHGIPSKKQKLIAGDIVSVDVTFNLKGWHGDSCWTYPVGEVDKTSKTLIDIAKNALKIGIEQVIPGEPLSNIGQAIEEYCEKHNAHVFRDFCGHSIGQYMHMAPQVLHHYRKSPLKIKPGMMFTIEPIITMDSTEFTVDKDGWSVVSNGRSAQFEVTLGVDENGPIIFTDIFKKMDSVSSSKRPKV